MNSEPVPDLTRTKSAVKSLAVRSTSLVVIALLASLYTLYFARAFFVPIVFAVLLNFLLSPAIRALTRIKIRPQLGAAIVVVALLAAVGGSVYGLAGPAQSVAASAPATLTKANAKLRALFLARMQKATSQVEKAAGTLGDSVGQRPSREIVVNSEPSIGSRIVGTTQVIIAAVLEITFLLYFLLAAGDLFLQKFVKVLPEFDDKRKAVDIARAVESAVSAYLTVTLLVNLGEGIVVSVLLWGLGMPSPALWGALVMLAEFIPYLGALTAVVLLGLAGLTTFENAWHAVLVPGSFLLVNLIQSNLVSPSLLGRRLTLNPVAIFIGLTFFFWIWGVAGAFLAVPLLASLKIFCDHIESFAALGEFLGARDDAERRAIVRANTPVA